MSDADPADPGVPEELIDPTTLPPPPPGAVPVGRHAQLTDLPPAVAERLRFDNAAPRRLRSDKLPEPVRAELRDLWDSVAADVYDEVAGLSRRKAFSSDTIRKALERVRDRLLRAERVVIFAAVHYPMRGDRPWRHLALAGVGGGSAAAAEEIAVFASAGTATATAILAALVGEVFETYVAASARTRQYRSVSRSPDPDVVLTDLAEAAGYGSAAGRRATPAIARDAGEWLGELIVGHTAGHFARGLIPIIGVGIGAGTAAYNVRQVVRLPLRPHNPDEVMRIADEILADPHAYADARARYLEEGRP